jgi:hypothetical protein
LKERSEDRFPFAGSLRKAESDDAKVSHPHGAPRVPMPPCLMRLR